MRISLSWLRDHVDLDGLTPDEIAARLTLAGLEAWTEAFGVLAAEIRAVAPHPDADRLTVCEVFDGLAERTVVCGAPNARAGLITALVTPGVTLPGGTEVKAASLRGVASAGMLCAEDELGLSDDHEGILELPADTPLGGPVHESLASWADVVVELDLTPNRADCLSHIGVARELAALLERPRRTPAVSVSEQPDAGPAAEAATVEIVDSEKCPRYAARIIEGVTIGPSPAWVARRLEAAGMRAINNVVDATNYVLLERGHPLHAFDLDRLAGQRIVVRRAGSGERFTTLDGEARILTADDLMIADGAQAVAIAGVMGGLDSEVTAQTTRILLESAYFEPRSVRRTSKRHELATESARRFAGGADPAGVVTAADACAALIAEWAGGQVRPGVIDEYPRPVPAAEVPLRVARTNQLLGTALGADEVRGLLARLEFDVGPAQGDALPVTVPTFRPDVTREVDLIEEVARLHGFDRIPAVAPRAALTAPQVDPARALELRVRDALVAAGGRQAFTYSFLDPADLGRLQCTDAHDPFGDLVRAANPIKAEYSALRSTLLPGLLRCLRNNVNQRASGVFLFELGTLFRDHPRSAENLPCEWRAAGGLLWGEVETTRWLGAPRPVDFFDAKGAVEAVLATLGIGPAAQTWLRDRLAFGNPHATAAVHHGAAEAEGPLGWVCELRPEVCAAFDVPAPVFGFELQLGRVAQGLGARPTYQPLPRFPGSRRDVALIVDEEVAAAELLQAAGAAGARFVEGIEIFDVYRGAAIPKGRKSVALAVTYRSLEGSLEGEAIDAEHGKLVAALRASFRAEIRDAG